MPCSLSVAAMAGVPITALVASASAFFTAAGVPRGTATTFHRLASNGAARSADSAMVGISGANVSRWALATPTICMRPLR
ncbi:hypothetical protein D3C71_1707260 [compost metagenome]